MHNVKRITHRDIKLENILCTDLPDESIQVKLTDFGFACHFLPENE
jgi:serine/threonine protein kinase